MDRHDPYWYEVHHGPGPFAWLVFALLLVAVVGLIVVAARWWLVSRSSGLGAGVSPSVPSGLSGLEEALQIARLRYARGEMSRDEFLQVTEDLPGPKPPAQPADTTN
jgi:uncharacterized membrane protein